jgi:hypothetical protein
MEIGEPIGETPDDPPIWIATDGEASEAQLSSEGERKVDPVNVVVVVGGRKRTCCGGFVRIMGSL